MGKLNKIRKNKSFSAFIALMGLIFAFLVLNISLELINYPDTFLVILGFTLFLVTIFSYMKLLELLFFNPENLYENENKN